MGFCQTKVTKVVGEGVSSDQHLPAHSDDLFHSGCCVLDSESRVWTTHRPLVSMKGLREEYWIKRYAFKLFVLSGKNSVAAMVREEQGADMRIYSVQHAHFYYFKRNL